MSFVVPELVEPVKAFATALGIGLLIGMERERRPDSAAGLRTFSLVAMLGCLFALLDERSGSTWMLAVGLLVIAGSMIASNFSSQQEEQYRGFTSEAAIVITYGLGAAVWLGYATLAVMLAIATTVLLYFKAELKQFSQRTTPKDINSILQFAVLSFVILPILPSDDFGPYNAINPRQIWWMVVLISGLALAGYLALRIIGTRHGAAVLGIFGGLASSTATTMMFSRHARNHADLVRMSAIVILIANVMVMIRLGLVAGVVAPHLAKPIAIVFLCGIVPGVAMALYGWKVLSGAENLPMPEVKNPTELKTAVSFGLLYAGDIAATHPVYATAPHDYSAYHGARNRMWLARRHLPLLLHHNQGIVCQNTRGFYHCQHALRQVFLIGRVHDDQIESLRRCVGTKRLQMGDGCQV